MTAFVWKDMRHHARQWLWSLLVTTTGGAFIGVIIVSWWSALQWSTAQSSSSEYIGLTHILGSNLITYSGLSVAVVISTTLALTVAAQARSHALWKIIGIPSRRIRRIILAQIGVVGLLGGLIGALLSAPVTRWYLLTWRELELYPADMPVIMPVFAPPLTIGLTTAFSLLGGLGAARRAASTPEMQALREAVAPAARTRVWQWVVAGVLLLGMVAVAVITLVDPNVLAATGALDPETATEMAAHRAEDPGTLGGSMVLLGMIAVL